MASNRMRALALGLALLPGAPASAAMVTGVATEATRVTVSLDGAVEAKDWFALAGPDRLVIDLARGRTSAFAVAGAGLSRRARIAQFDPATARLVIELAAPARVERVETVAGALVVTLARLTAAEFAALPRRGRIALAATPPAMPPPLPLVMIDPGHGGHDVGAVSPHEGRYEKDATLAIARAIARELEAGGRVRAALTRDDDRFLALGERVRLARAAGASLFLSVHADAALNDQARGATVYTLSEVASDRMAARLAARENKAGAVAGLDLGGEDAEAATILYDIAKRRAMNASAAFAQTLQRELSATVPFTGDFHRFAGFQVLKTADMPAVLLETGYLTHADDARRLFSGDGQRAIAKGARAAIEAHFAPRMASAAVSAR